MKTVVFGDIHGRTIWKNIVEKNLDADRYVFLGDYVSTHDNISSQQQIDNMNEILEFAEKLNNETPGKVILLRGNHDMQHLGYKWAECCSFDYKVYEFMSSIKDKFLSATQWIYKDNNIVYSHAGVSEVWMNSNNINSINDINNLEPSGIFGFTPCKFSDYCGESVTQPPTWIRPWILLGNEFGNYTYIVGHTSYKRIVNLKNELLDNYMKTYKDNAEKETLDLINSYNDIWACDALEYNEYAIVEDGKVIPCKI